VQSVATRLVVERERDRMAFVPAAYWDVTGSFALADDAAADAGTAFSARLVQLGESRVATGRDFDDRGRPTPAASRDGVRQLDGAAAAAVVAGLEAAPFTVRSVETKPYTRRPATPFTTSTLQQEAGRKLRLSSRQAMRVAQGLYENGYITYMRTDSPALSAEATDAARRQASELYGPEYVPSSPRVYQSKAKGAQEAHEAIRPAGDSFRTPAQVANELRGDEFRLYELIWKRTVASQMADAKGSTASVRLAAPVVGGPDAGSDAVFAASGTVITFRGFLAAYEESADVDERAEGADAAAAGSGKDARLPQMAEGDGLRGRDLTADGHSTSAPARFTEASLIKKLEELGIGRPSTYASTISTIQDRGYVTSRGQALVPSWVAFAVVRLLTEHFSELVDYRFTAKMEEDLDAIAAGDRDRVAWLTEFYFGDEARGETGLKDLVDNLGEIDARGINSIEIGEGIQVRIGRYGPYVEDLSSPVAEGATPPRASIPDEIAPDELTVAKARELLEAGADDGRELGVDPDSGHTIIAKSGRYGPYVTEVLPEPELEEGLSAAALKRAKAALPKPRTGSLLKSQSLATVGLDEALALLSLPRVVGTDPENDTVITAQNGRYGPYLKRGTDSRSLPSEESIFTVTLEEALAIYAQPKRGRGATAAPPLKELGEDPVSGKAIVVKDGRFGPYVTDGQTNATLRKDDPVDTLTPERAQELLAEKRAKGPAKKKAPAKRAPAKAKAAPAKPKGKAATKA
jgi:DNA topoisomerase-1